MSQTRKSSGMGATYAIYGAILAIAMVQVVVAITLGPSLWRMLVFARGSGIPGGYVFHASAR